MTPFLTEAEINELCKPLVQRKAQARRLCSLLNLSELPRRPDGLPIVGRKLFEERMNGLPARRTAMNWSK